MTRTIIVSESELRSIVAAMVKAEIAEIFAPFVGRVPAPSTPKWLPSAQAEQALGMGYEELARKRRAGWFTEGVHYRICNDNPSAKANGIRYQYNVQAIEHRLSERRSKRKIK